MWPFDQASDEPDNNWTSFAPLHPSTCGTTKYGGVALNNAAVDAMVQSEGIDPSFHSIGYFVTNWTAVRSFDCSIGAA